MKYRVRAPSNIALIKYMGKKDSTLNLPENPSLSMTLNSLSTYLNVELSSDGEPGKLRVRAGFDQEGLALSSAQVPELKGTGLEKLAKHWERVAQAAPALLREAGFRAREKAPAHASIQTANTFPMGSGIASSASSFAALTLAGLVANAAQDDFARLREFWRRSTPEAMRLRRQCARIARQGSGSSCRSFEGPWVEWNEEEASAFSTKMPEMAHFVVVISKTEKLVSSSQAHLKVKTSPQWEGRVERVNNRFLKMKRAMEAGDLDTVSKLSWNEMWEMHNLFHTASEPFSYWQPGTINAIHSFAEDLKSADLAIKPMITLDAGPNVHVLVPATESSRWSEVLAERFGSENILHDRQGTGAEIL